MLTAGSRLGAYEILSSIGAGGMGEVYRARDLKLAREVAIKVLPDAFASDQDRLLRFQREAQLLASVSHPNIAGIYGLEESDGVTALVLELVPGETLADRLARGPIAVDEALAIATQIASGVDAAHELGIIHRDLKPANIKVTPDGTVKVLDFGLAKLTDQAVASTQSASVSLSPTITSPALTNVGMILGTAAYMSPEQAKGRPADRRSDVWAFGCLLYEMLTGRRAFDGEDVPETMAAVLRGEPDWVALPQDVPPAIRTLLQRCLAKDRRKRPAGMAAVLFILDEHAHFSVSGGVDERARRAEIAAAVAQADDRHGRRTRFWVLALTAAAAVLSLGAAAATWYAMRQGPAPVLKLGLTAGAGPGSTTSPNSNDVAITPDGRDVVYFTGSPNQPLNSLAVRSLDQRGARPLPVNTSLGPFTSWDGQWVGFFDQGDRSMKKIPIRGGPIVPIVTDISAMRGASWGRDDRIVYSHVAAYGLWRVAASGGRPEQLTKPADENRETHDWPHVLPDGRHVLFTIANVGVDDARIALLDLETRTHRVVIPNGSYPRYAKTGHIVYASGGTLFAVGFDLARLTVTTTPVSVVEEVTVKDTGAASFDLSDNGTLVYVPGQIRRGTRRVAWLDRDGTLSPIEALEPGDYRSVQLNRDATHLALETGTTGDGNLWTFDLRRGTRNALTTDRHDDRSPIWSPDQRRIAFGSGRDGWGVFAINADGGGTVERLARIAGARELWVSSWSSDGHLAFSANTGGNGDIGLLTFGKSDVDWRMKTSAIEGTPVIAPNRQWIAYTSQLAGRSEVYLERFPQLGDRRSVSAAGGQLPLWSRDGRELYFMDATRTQIMAVTIRYGSGDSIDVSPPTPLVKAAIFGARGWRAYDVTPDGRFIIITMDVVVSDPEAIPIVEPNWFDTLRRRVPVD